MRSRPELLSWIVFGFGVVCALGAIGMSLWWAEIARTSDGFLGLGFIFVGAPIYGFCAAMCGILPATIMYRRERRDRDLHSLWLTAGGFTLVAAEFVAVFFLPLYGC